jgi:DnaK suppressor protein
MQIKRKLTEREQRLFHILADEKNKVINEIAHMTNSDIHDVRAVLDTVGDKVDLSVLIDQNKEVEWALMNTYNDRLKAIEEAMSRLAGGTYGFCQNCDQPIPEKRLAALPFAQYCIQCQKGKREGRERIEQRESEACRLQASIIIMEKLI